MLYRVSEITNTLWTNMSLHHLICSLFSDFLSSQDRIAKSKMGGMEPDKKNNKSQKKENISNLKRQVPVPVFNYPEI